MYLLHGAGAQCQHTRGSTQSAQQFSAPAPALAAAVAAHCTLRAVGEQRRRLAEQHRRPGDADAEWDYWSYLPWATKLLNMGSYEASGDSNPDGNRSLATHDQKATYLRNV